MARRGRLAFLLVAAALPAGCAAVDGGFDADRWREARGRGCGGENPRLAMFEGLRSRLLDERPTRVDALALLGPPDAARGGSIDYVLGRNVIDSVRIEFGRDRQVTGVRYVQG